MELGALICVARNPKCRRCPLRRDCAAERPDQLPMRRPLRRDRSGPRNSRVHLRARKTMARACVGAAVARNVAASCKQTRLPLRGSRRALLHHPISRDDANLRRVAGTIGIWKAIPSKLCRRCPRRTGARLQRCCKESIVARDESSRSRSRCLRPLRPIRRQVCSRRLW